MIRSATKFVTGVRSLAFYWQAWLVLLVVVNFVAPLFFLRYFEAQLCIAVFFMSGFIGVVLVKLQGFTRLLGLMHFAWFPMIAFFCTHLAHHSSDQPYGLWLRLVIAVNTLSLVIDTVDVVRYVLGNRKEILS